MACVYRFYDAEGALLYIGHSCELVERLSGHRSQSPWWRKVATVKVEHFETRSEAKVAEAVAIDAERPRYNINHNPSAVRAAWRLS